MYIQLSRRLSSMAWSNAMDMISGMAVSLWLLSDNNISFMAKLIADNGQDAMGLVERQLVWLMAVPAELKLNSALDQLLGEILSVSHWDLEWYEVGLWIVV